MKIRFILSIFLAISIFACTDHSGQLEELNERYESAIENKVRSERNSQLFAAISNGIKLDSIAVKDQNEKLFLLPIGRNDSSIFFRWNYEVCDLCVDQELKRIEKLIIENNQANFVLLVTPLDFRKFKYLKNKFKALDVYFVDQSLPLPIEQNLRVPYYFRLENNRVSNVYVPFYTDSTFVPRYLESMNQRMQR